MTAPCLRASTHNVVDCTTRARLPTRCTVAHIVDADQAHTHTHCTRRSPRPYIALIENRVTHSDVVDARRQEMPKAKVLQALYIETRRITRKHGAKDFMGVCKAVRERLKYKSSLARMASLCIQVSKEDPHITIDLKQDKISSDLGMFARRHVLAIKRMGTQDEREQLFGDVAHLWKECSAKKKTKTLRLGDSFIIEVKERTNKQSSVCDTYLHCIVCNANTNTMRATYRSLKEFKGMLMRGV